MQSNLLYRGLTKKIIKCFYEVYNELGSGFLESVYENALKMVLISEGMNVEQQKAIPVHFRNVIVGDFRADLLVNQRIILELKAVNHIKKEHIAQLINYLKATDIKVGLLLNFGDKPEFKRMAFTKMRTAKIRGNKIIDIFNMNKYREIVDRMLADDPFSRWMGIEIINVAEGHCVLEMTVRDDMLNGFGVCHGGILFSLADSALAFASNTHGRVALAVEDNISFLRKVESDDRLRAVTEELSKTRNTGVYTVTIKRKDDIVATFRGTVYKREVTHFISNSD